jgi:hypothetical protein
MTITIIQTPQSRHVENVIFGGYHAGDLQTLCGKTYGGAFTKLTEAKRVQLPRIPAAAVCGECVAIARRWYADFWFEPFDCVQRQRLLANLDRDLATVA